MAKIVYRRMPAPWELLQQMPTPQGKARMHKPQGGGKFLVQIPGGVHVGGGGMVMDKIDTCIINAPKFSCKFKHFLGHCVISCVHV